MSGPQGGDGQDEGGQVGGVIVGVGADLVSPDDPRVRAHQDEDAPDQEQRNALTQTLRKETLSRLQGEAAAYFREECEASDQSRIDWRALLRVWLHDRVLTDWRSYPFSKKHLARGLFMPSLGVDAPGHIVFAIDTSGSMDLEQIGEILGEVRAFRETFPCRLTLIQCDAEIQDVVEYEAMDGTEVPDLLPLKGRGGTSFAPVFDWIANRSLAQAPILLYATDGYGSFWDRTPDWPVVWLMTDRQVTVPHGWVVRI
jgi:predicted metal-dependent peptidase